MELPRNSAPSVAVIGAGLQGCTLALALSKRGIPVDLFDRDTLISKAGRWNEAKLHLGFVYALDPSLRTAHRMVEGALHFLPFLRETLGPIVDEFEIASPFDYVVHRESLVSPDQFHRHLESCLEICKDAGGFDSGSPDFGFKLEAIRERPLAPDYHPDQVDAVFQTPEISLRPEQLARAIREQLKGDPNVRLWENRPIDRIERRDQGGFLLFPATETRPLSYREVVNCAWAERLRFDQQLGLPPSLPWTHRFKVGTHLRGANQINLPSCTIVLGAFGDVVNFGRGNLYFSWYPSGRILSSCELVPPTEQSVVQGVDLDRIERESLEALAKILPGLNAIDLEASPRQTRGGYIFAWGEGDVDIRDTQLHERSTIGIYSLDGYHSVNTGKLTMVTVYAEEAAQKIVQERR